jgi:hypothetical protein
LVKIYVVYLSFTEYDDIDIPCEVNMDDNIWEYPFGDLEDDEELFDRKPVLTGNPASDNLIVLFKQG